MGMRVAVDDLWLCVDCTMVAVNGDSSGIDGDDRTAEVEAAVAAMGPHLVSDSGSDEGEGEQEFSWSECDCCGSTLGGSRHRFAILEAEPAEGERWPNPWSDEVVYVPIDELAQCCYGLGKSWGMADGSSRIMTAELMLEHWRTRGDRLDAYILPHARGHHTAGVRYGAKDSAYLSPHFDEKKLDALLKKVRGR